MSTVLHKYLKNTRTKLTLKLYERSEIRTNVEFETVKMFNFNKLVAGAGGAD